MMARSEAQRAADKRYREKVKDNKFMWVTQLNSEEAAELNALIAEKGMNKAQFLRWAMAKLKEEGIDG